MESGVSYYKLLGIPKTATQTEIRTAYRKKALDVHPDKGGSNSADAFVTLQKAYDVLSDIQQRAAYDATLKVEMKRKASFKGRPPPLQDVVQPVTYILGDDKPYIFETAAVRIRSGVSHGDFVKYIDSTGSFVGLAGDQCWWWTKSGDEFPTKLCDPSSDMTRSHVQVLSRVKVPTKTSTKPFVAMPKPSTSSSAKSDEDVEEKRRLVKKEALEKMRQAILEEGRKSVRENAVPVLLEEERQLRYSRETFLFEALYLLHTKYSTLKILLSTNIGPSEGEWRRMFLAAREPLPPFYGKEHHHVDPASPVSEDAELPTKNSSASPKSAGSSKATASPKSAVAPPRSSATASRPAASTKSTARSAAAPPKPVSATKRSAAAPKSPTPPKAPVTASKRSAVPTKSK